MLLIEVLVPGQSVSLVATTVQGLINFAADGVDWGMKRVFFKLLLLIFDLIKQVMLSFLLELLCHRLNNFIFPSHFLYDLFTHLVYPDMLGFFIILLP